jgi:hypothetical protein
VTGAVAVAALVGLASLLAGVALGVYLRRTTDWCRHCGNQLTCAGCRDLTHAPRETAAL